MTSNIFQYSINDGFLWSEVSLKGEKNYYIEGYASTIDKDKSGEVIDMSAQHDIFNQAQNESITMDVEHSEWYDDNGKLLSKPKNTTIPVAKIVHAEMREKGVWVKAQINKNLRSFTELWGSIKDGFLKAFSVAFYPTEKSGSIIKHLNLVNVTLTGSPVNPNATFAVSMKSAAAWMATQSQPDIKSEAITMEEKVIVPEVKAEPVIAVPEVKAEAVIAVPEVKSEPVFDVQAELKAMKDAHAAELLALHSEVASLKAELAKPVMKATVEAKMPEDKATQKIISPLGLVR